VLEQLRSGSAILIDIRTQREKETGGVPELPSSFNRRSYEVEYASFDDKRLRGALRDPKVGEWESRKGAGGSRER
jgi:hypothetical protein